MTTADMPQLPPNATMRLGDGPEEPLDAEKLTAHIAAVLKGGPSRMKADPDFDRMNDSAYRVTADELRQFIERYEQLESEKKDIADQQKDVMAEAKGRGYDTKAMRKIIAIRKRKPDELAEEEAILEVYKQALGMD